MQDRVQKLLSIDNSVYLNKDSLKGLLTKLNSFKINANIKDSELYDIDFIRELKGKEYLLIDTDASSDIQQKRFISIIKDKKFRSFNFDKNIKVIVSSGDINNVTGEVLSLLIIE